ncbi:MAG: MBL fold metallo-hydrolase [Chitinophagaceae bacterium]|nr:MBL fold metallo-hydrolase [Chitinophagaceae bacterium]MCW5928109.1 MBL fold metallo-hydrolase [Chitinophagaceae bacterium]
MFDVKVFTFSPIQENTYLLWNEDKNCIIIDPGCYFDYEKEELAVFIDNNGLKPSLLLNTHCHLDHVFGNKWVADTYQLELHIHPDEKELLAYAPASGLMWNLPFDNYTGNLLYLREGGTIQLGEDKLEILLTPGHSPGSVSFYCPQQHFIIAGDVLFRMSIGRTDLPGGKYETLEKSILTQLYTLPDDTIVYPGHGEPTTIGFEKKNNPFVSI